ncbi:MAG: ABC transporter ATP-binding protein [Bacteroidota bacterium]
MQLTIRGLSKTYPNGTQALKKVDLTISNGMFGLLGPNGAGKSTLMRTLATLQDADSGSASLDGLDILNEKDEVRKILGYLPQSFGVYPDVNAEDMLDHFARLKGIHNRAERKETVKALLEQTNLYQVRRRKVGGFSGGMRQRFGIAQALLGNPKLVIVDEPTAGLDPAERHRFHNLLAEIGENIIIILSTHIVEDVSDLCENMAILYRGEVIESGMPFELMDRENGKIWTTTIEKSELSRYKDDWNVISFRHFAGKIVIRVYHPHKPSPEFDASPASLEDVYFTRTLEKEATIAKAQA